MEPVDLIAHISAQPLEYSYFDQNVLSAWAGPQHWKIKPVYQGKSIHYNIFKRNHSWDYLVIFSVIASRENSKIRKFYVW